MSWGDAFTRAYEGASAAARAAADLAMSSARAAADAAARGVQLAAAAGARAAQATENAAVAGAQVAKEAVVAGARAVKDGAVAAGSAAKQGGGEAINIAAGVILIAGAKQYAVAKAMLSNDPPASQRLIERCPMTSGNIYTGEYRASLVNSTFHGAGDPRLAAAMSALRKPLSHGDVEANLQTIAKLRDRPIEDIRKEYEKYVELKDAVDDRIIAKKGEKIPSLRPNQAEFMGSVWQLRYGQVVGDELGIDPAFGAMLNPTGGLVGPGSDWGDAGAPDGKYMPESVAYHGAYHDAMGYLYNQHDKGPGYNYVHSPFGFETGNPLAGQTTGIPEWVAILAR